MKLSTVLFAAAAAQDEGSDRWTYSDYSVDNNLSLYGGKAGAATSGAYGYGTDGNKHGNGRFCHSTKDTVHIYRWDVSKYGYFAHYNQVECVGEELYCFIEERAHFGQIIGIRAGCAQMMNHPQVERNDADNTSFNALPYISPVYNQEAARGRTFDQNTKTGTAYIYYGIGGCLSHPAQNGNDQLHSEFLTSMSNNHYAYGHGGWYQSQCLRTNGPNGNAELLPFGVSVCRACCLATYSDDMYLDAARTPDTPGTPGSNRGVCNFLPYPAQGGNPGLPKIPDETVFDCYKGVPADNPQSNNCDSTTVSDATGCDYCTKQIYPTLTMYEVPNYESDFSQNLFESNFVRASGADAAGPCDNGSCTPTGVIAQPMV